MRQRRQQREDATLRYVEGARDLAVAFDEVAEGLARAPRTQRAVLVLRKGATVLRDTPTDVAPLQHLERSLGQILYGVGQVRVEMSVGEEAKVERLSLDLEDLLSKAHSERALDYYGDSVGDAVLTVRDFTGQGLRSGHRTDPPEGVVVHYTGGGGIWGTVEALKARGLSYHYVLGRDGTVYKLVGRERRAHHAGGRHNRLPGGGSPSGTIGIALANYGYGRKGVKPGADWEEREATEWDDDRKEFQTLGLRFEPFPSAQLDALVELTARVLKENQLGPEAVWAHSQVNERKPDPGPLFPMARFKENLGERLATPPVVGATKRWQQVAQQQGMGWEGPALLLALIAGIVAAHLRRKGA